MATRFGRGAMTNSWEDIKNDVRYTRTAAVSDIFVQIRPGSDIAFMGGLINYVLQNKKYNEEYLRHFTNKAVLLKIHTRGSGKDYRRSKREILGSGKARSRDRCA